MVNMALAEGVNLSDVYCANLIESSGNLLSRIKANAEQANRQHEKIVALRKDLKDALQKDAELVRAAAIIGTVSDNNTQRILDQVTGLVNRALAILFPSDRREVRIEKSIYRETHVHYNVVLYVGEQRTPRKFKLSGSGLGQAVSFLFNIALIDIQNKRRIFVCDEILNGLHPDAKDIIIDLIKALSDRFQFIITEYGLDIGTQLLVLKDSLDGTVSNVTPYVGGTYYRDLAIKRVTNVDGQLAYNEGGEEYEAQPTLL